MKSSISRSNQSKVNWAAIFFTHIQEISGSCAKVLIYCKII